MEGIHTTLDDVLINQLTTNNNDKNMNEVFNYINATALGIDVAVCKYYIKQRK